MPVTSLKLPYPAPDDPIADYPAQASSMAWTLDAILSRLAPLTAPVIVGSKPAGAIVPQFLVWKQTVSISAGLATITPPMTHGVTGLLFAAVVPLGHDAQARALTFSVVTEPWSWSTTAKTFTVATNANLNASNVPVSVFAVLAKEI